MLRRLNGDRASKSTSIKAQKAGIMRKKEALQSWADLNPGADPLQYMAPIPYKAKGSTYGACGVRIDGNPQFIDAVLSNLKTLLDGENNVTRLGLSRNPVDGEGLKKRFDNKARNAEVCYIRLHMRGNEGQIAAAIMHEHDTATQRYADSIGAVE